MLPPPPAAAKRPSDAQATPRDPARPAVKRARCARPRSTCSAALAPLEVFRLLAGNIAPHGGALLRLAMTCRAARDAILRDHALWFEVLRDAQVAHFRSRTWRSAYVGPAVVRSIPMSPYSNFKSMENDMHNTSSPPFLWQIQRLNWPHLRSADKTGAFTPEETAAFAEHAVTTARLDTALHCGLCKSRHRHIPVWGLGMRVCVPCFKANLVSSASLFHDYGVDFNKHAGRIAGAVYFFRHAFNLSVYANYLTHNPVDFGHGKDDCMLFFWLPHLSRVIDLQAARAEFKSPERRAAAERLTAVVRALGTRLTIGQKGKSLNRFSNHQFYTRAGAKAKKRQGFDTAAPLTEEQYKFIDRHLPMAFCRPVLMNDEGTARQMLQRSFLAFRGDLRLPCVRNAEVVLERLWIMQAVRADHLIRKRSPDWSATTRDFRKWADMKPARAVA